MFGWGGTGKREVEGVKNISNLIPFEDLGAMGKETEREMDPDEFLEALSGLDLIPSMITDMMTLSDLFAVRRCMQSACLDDTIRKRIKELKVLYNQWVTSGMDHRNVPVGGEYISTYFRLISDHHCLNVAHDYPLSL